MKIRLLPEAEKILSTAPIFTNHNGQVLALVSMTVSPPTSNPCGSMLVFTKTTAALLARFQSVSHFRYTTTG